MYLFIYLSTVIQKADSFVNFQLFFSFNQIELVTYFYSTRRLVGDILKIKKISCVQFLNKYCNIYS